MNETDKPTPALDALAELAAIRDYIIGIQGQLKKGHMPDMTMLEQRTVDMCRIITKSSASIQKECAPELKELAQQIDDCEKDLRAFFETVIADMDQKR